MQSRAQTSDLELPSYGVLDIFEQNEFLKTLVCVVSLTQH